MSVTFVGITRFSLVTFDSLQWFQSTRGLSIEEAKALVFERRRLDMRLRMFSRYALPTYAALTRRERSHALILINRDLPVPIRKRLHEMVAPHPGIQIVAVGDGQSFKWPPKKISIELAERGRLFSYRLDDDDALSPAYFDVIGAAVENLPDGTAISAADGWMVSSAGGDRMLMQRSVIPQCAQGLGVVSSGGPYLTAFHLNSHMSVHTRFPVHLVSTERPLWLRTRHGNNDSLKNRGAPPEEMEAPQAVEVLKPDFPFIGAGALRLLSPPAQPASAAPATL